MRARWLALAATRHDSVSSMPLYRHKSSERSKEAIIMIKDDSSTVMTQHVAVAASAVLRKRNVSVFNSM